MCDEIFECVRIHLVFSKEKYTSDFRDTRVVRCSNIDVLLEKVYNISGQVHDLHLKIGLDNGQSYTKLVLRLQHENSVNNLVYLWVGSAPENNHNFSVIIKNGEISHLLEHDHVSFTFDLKEAALCLGIMSRIAELVDSCFRKHIDGNVEELLYQFEDAFIQSGNSY